jgi:hypothetical protein
MQLYVIINTKSHGSRPGVDKVHWATVRSPCTGVSSGKIMVEAIRLNELHGDSRRDSRTV